MFYVPHHSSALISLLIHMYIKYFEVYPYAISSWIQALLHPTHITYFLLLAGSVSNISSQAYRPSIPITGYDIS